MARLTPRLLISLLLGFLRAMIQSAGNKPAYFLARSCSMASALDFQASPLMRLISNVQTRLNASRACASVNSIPAGKSGAMSSVRLRV